MTVGFGIIGCGMIANFHCRAIEEIPRAKVVGCFDMYEPAAERLAEQYGCRAYAKLATMLADDAIDVVTICTPSGAHMEPAVEAAKAGKGAAQLDGKMIDAASERMARNIVSQAELIATR